MSIYKTIATYVMATIPMWSLAIANGVSLATSEIIDGYRVSEAYIGHCDDLSCIYWSDTDGDGQFDKKQRATLTPPRGPPITIDLPFEESDRKLTEGLVAKLK